MFQYPSPFMTIQGLLLPTLSMIFATGAGISLQRASVASYSDLPIRSATPQPLSYGMPHSYFKKTK
jgi:hypothetical protein